VPEGERRLLDRDEGQQSKWEDEAFLRGRPEHNPNVTVNGSVMYAMENAKQEPQ
jgi:hypothetical protein